MTVIGKEYCVRRLQMRYIADSSASPYVLMLERWMLLLLYIQRSAVLLVRNFVHENHKWNFLPDVSTSPYVLMLERWILAFSYIQRSTVLLERVLCMEIANGLFSWFKNESICPDVKTLNATISYIQRPKLLLVRDIVYEDHKWIV